ncbi:MAG: formylglycine-generating enzyme family protein [Polyangiaceae bacterium]
MQNGRWLCLVVVLASSGCGKLLGFEDAQGPAGGALGSGGNSTSGGSAASSGANAGGKASGGAASPAGGNANPSGGTASGGVTSVVSEAGAGGEPVTPQGGSGGSDSVGGSSPTNSGGKASGGTSSGAATGGAATTGGTLASGGAAASGGSATSGGQSSGGAVNANEPPSCKQLAPNCGANQESCCTSPLVTGGTLYLGYDGVYSKTKYYLASVADFRLDKFEVTVGRYRAFVEAWVGGFRPAAGAGKHVHLNSGNGLAGANGGFETGWDTAWASKLPSTRGDFDTKLLCAQQQTWTPNVGNNEHLPANCIDWYQAAAFCTWDGGFLPSYAENIYVGHAGAEQRVYPWGATEPGANAQLAVYGGYYGTVPPMCIGTDCFAPVGMVPAGNSKFGQSDIAGNVWEWTFDYWTNLTTPCSNCAYLQAYGAEAVNCSGGPCRYIRGGGANSSVEQLRVAAGSTQSPGPDTISWAIGVRCARVP